MLNFGLFPITLVLGLLARTEAQEAPEFPSTDDFYKPDPSEWADKKAGELVDWRPISIESEFLPNYEAWQLLYVTQNLDQSSTTSVTTIIVPEGANTSRILSYQIAYDSPDVNCSPSYGLQPGANEQSAPFTKGQMKYLKEILREIPDEQPPVLNIPDYEGFNAAFTVGPQSAYQTLDSIRAATQPNSTRITGVDPNAEVVLFGYSGGALASEWAVEFHSEYASEVNIIAAAIGGPPTNAVQTYRNVNMRYPGLAIWAMLGVMNAIPDINETMTEDLKPHWSTMFLSRRQRCTVPARDLPKIPPLANVSSWFEHGAQFLTEFEEELTEIGVMGNHISPENPPTFPLYIFQGGLDEVTWPLSDTRALKETFCRAGTPVFMIEYRLQFHLGAVEKGSPPAMEWIRAVFNREEIEITNCAGPDAVDLVADTPGGTGGLGFLSESI